jgi:hypothetical protein
MFLKIVQPGRQGCADLAVLRRRTYMRVLKLPKGRALIAGRLPL